MRFASQRSSSALAARVENHCFENLVTNRANIFVCHVIVHAFVGMTVHVKQYEM